MNEQEEAQAFALYDILINQIRDMDIGVAASVLITILGNLPKRVKDDLQEGIIIQQATAVVAEGITENGSMNAEKCIQTADDLLPFFAEAFEKYKQSKTKIELNS